MKKLLLLTIAIILLSSQAKAYCGVKPMKPIQYCSGYWQLVCEQVGDEQYRWICVR